MNTRKRPLSVRFAAAAGALSIALVGLASPALAAEGNIDPDAKGSLIIHKHEGGTQTAPGTPDGQTPTAGTGVKDVVFTAYRITNLDLGNDQAAWNGLKDLPIPATACDGTPGVKPTLTLPGVGSPAAVFANGVASPKTDAAGDTTIGNLPVGAYVVCETEAPATVKTKAAPFLVTIPFPNNTANTASPDGNWLYHVNVYPKNTVVNPPVKALDVASNGLGTEDQLTYTITAQIPNIPATDSFTHFIITDTMSTGHEGVKVDSVTLDGASLTLNTDYKVTVKDGKQHVSLLKPALILAKTKGTKNVVVTFKAKASAVSVLNNVANYSVGHKPGDNPPENPPEEPPTDEPENPTNKVVSSWGDVVIKKKDKDNNKVLKGATFEVYNAQTAYGDTCSAVIDPANSAPISVNGKTTFTTGDDGLATIAGLFVDKGSATKPAGAATYGDPVWDNNNTHRCYVLKEVAAPAGYVLPQGNAALTAVKVTPGATAASSFDAVIDNAKQDVPELPLTGANGQLLLSIIGAALLLAATGSVFVLRHRRNSDA